MNHRKEEQHKGNHKDRSEHLCTNNTNQCETLAASNSSYRDLEQAAYKCSINRFLKWIIFKNGLTKINPHEEDQICGIWEKKYK